MDESDGNYMVINGVRYPVINSWVDAGPAGDGRRRWGIVTAEEQPAQLAGATALPIDQRPGGEACPGHPTP
jgi:hypothetical protein